MKSSRTCSVKANRWVLKPTL